MPEPVQSAKPDERRWTITVAMGRDGTCIQTVRGPEVLNEVVAPESEVTRLRERLERVEEAASELAGWAEEARGHYGIEQTGGPGAERTGWDDVQDKLRDAAESMRIALADREERDG